MLLRDQSNSLELVELVQIFSTIYILEGVDKDKAVGKKSLLLSSSGPGTRSGPKTWTWANTKIGLPHTHSPPPPVNFSWADNQSKPLLNDF